MRSEASVRQRRTARLPALLVAFPLFSALPLLAVGVPPAVAASQPVEAADLRRGATLDLGEAELRGSTADSAVLERLRTLAPGWSFRSTPHLEVVADSTGGEAATVFRARFPAGWTGGYAPAWISRDLADEGFTEVHVSFRVRISENWQGHHVGDKLLYVWIHDNPAVFPAYVGGGHGPLRAQVRIQGVPGGARSFSSNLRGAYVERGRWHRWDVVLVAGTPGRDDGEIHWWIDGEKKGEHRYLRFADPGQGDVWHILSWRPIWGGSGGEVREDQFMWIDDLRVRGRR